MTESHSFNKNQRQPGPMENPMDELMKAFEQLYGVKLENRTHKFLRQIKEYAKNFKIANKDEQQDPS